MRTRCTRRINPLTRLPDSIQCQPGLERYILRKIPLALPLGAALILAPSAVLRIGGWGLHPQELNAIISRVDMFALGVLLVYWNLMVAVTWGAFIVMVMKGPTYVADSYPLIDADSPAEAPLPLGELQDQHGPEAFIYPGPNVCTFARNCRWRAHQHIPRRHLRPDSSGWRVRHPVLRPRAA